MTPFWLVWNETTGYTRFRHAEKPAAAAEAKRLATVNKGQRFYVLCAVANAVVQDPVHYEEIDVDSLIPF